MKKAQIRKHNGTPTLFMDDRPTFCAYLWERGPSAEGYEQEATARAYARAGIHFHAFDVGTVGVAPEWCGPRQGNDSHYDFSTLKARFERVLEADPQAHFHLRIHLRMQEWWLKLYPEEREIPSVGEGQLPVTQSFASQVWCRQAKDFLRAYVEAFREAGLEDRVFAYQVGAGNTSEWVKGDLSMDSVCGDYSAPMRQHFQAWLRREYGEDTAALRQAWADPTVDFDTAVVPAAEAQLRTLHFTFRDPRREQQVIDYYRCLAELCGDLVVDFCRTVKQATGGRTIAGAFFGYLMELAWNKSFFSAGTESEYSTYQRSGHLGLRRLLRSGVGRFCGQPVQLRLSRRGRGGCGHAAHRLAAPPRQALHLRRRYPHSPSGGNPRIRSLLFARGRHGRSAAQLRPDSDPRTGGVVAQSGRSHPRSGPTAVAGALSGAGRVCPATGSQSQRRDRRRCG